MNSNYNVQKWENDYERAQGHKKHLCEFPSINFIKHKSSSTTVGGDQANASLKTSFAYSKTKMGSLGSLASMGTLNPMRQSNNENNLKKSQRIKITTLYEKEIFMKDLMYCKAKFYIEDKKYNNNI